MMMIIFDEKYSIFYISSLVVPQVLKFHARAKTFKLTKQLPSAIFTNARPHIFSRNCWADLMAFDREALISQSLGEESWAEVCSKIC